MSVLMENQLLIGRTVKLLGEMRRREIFYLTHYVFTVFKKYTKYRIMLKIAKYYLKKCIKNTIMIKYNKILRNKLFTKPRSLKLM